MKTMIVKMLCIALLMCGFSSAAMASDTACAQAPAVNICHKGGSGSGSDKVGHKAGKHANPGHPGKAHKHKKHHKKHGKK